MQTTTDMLEVGEGRRHSCVREVCSAELECFSHESSACVLPGGGPGNEAIFRGCHMYETRTHFSECMH